jgi:hypothetical protein
MAARHSPSMTVPFARAGKPVLRRRVEPHRGGVLDTKAPYFAKRPVTADVVAVLHARAATRHLELTVHPSRAVCVGEVHEVFVTDERGKGPNSRVNRVGYLACIAIRESGMILAKDTCSLADRLVGEVIGFDETHLPNHLNIVIYTSALQTGREIGAQLGDLMSFEMSAYPTEILP